MFLIIVCSASPQGGHRKTSRGPPDWPHACPRGPQASGLPRRSRDADLASFQPPLGVGSKVGWYPFAFCSPQREKPSWAHCQPVSLEPPTDRVLWEGWSTGLTPKEGSGPLRKTRPCSPLPSCRQHAGPPFSAMNHGVGSTRPGVWAFLGATVPPAMRAPFFQRLRQADSQSPETWAVQSGSRGHGSEAGGDTG